MAVAVKLREDYSAAALRQLASRAKTVNQSRRLLSLAAVQDGMNRTAVRALWPDGLKDTWSKGNPPRLSADQQRELAALVEAGPDRAIDGVVRWRRVDLQRVIKERFGVAYHERTVGKALGFSHISARPQHPKQDERTIAAFKKLRGDAERPHRASAAGHAGRDLVPG